MIKIILLFLIGLFVCTGCGSPKGARYDRPYQYGANPSLLYKQNYEYGQPGERRMYRSQRDANERYRQEEIAEKSKAADRENVDGPPPPPMPPSSLVPVAPPSDH